MLRCNPDQNSPQEDLFRTRLDNMIDMRHALVRLSKTIDWDWLERSYSIHYCADNGRPGGSIRLMAGLLLLKCIKGLSDEEVCASWRENPYFQYFCGEEYFRHDFPIEPPSLSIFRKRIGEDGMALLLDESIRIGLKAGVVAQGDLNHVNVDTTVQEKAVRFPTDGNLCQKAREELVRKAYDNGIELRQSYARKGKEALFMSNKYHAARQMKRGRQQVKRLRNYLGRVMRDIKRGLEKNPSLEAFFASDLAKAEVIFNQTLNKDAKEKLYSWHAPEVECIAKGKAHKKYEFGCKASYATTSKSNFVLDAKALHGKPHDGHTLGDTLKRIAERTGVMPKEAYVDQGFKGHGVENETCQVIVSRQKRGITKTIKKRQKRRNAIEPVIGHMKNDSKTGPRNWLKGELGDKINAIAIAVGFNFRKILQEILSYLIRIIQICQNQSKPIYQI